MRSTAVLIYVTNQAGDTVTIYINIHDTCSKNLYLKCEFLVSNFSAHVN